MAPKFNLTTQIVSKPLCDWKLNMAQSEKTDQCVSPSLSVIVRFPTILPIFSLPNQHIERKAGMLCGQVSVGGRSWNFTAQKP